MSLCGSIVKRVNTIIDNLDDTSKLEKLPNIATYNQAVAKLNEIIKYCEDHPNQNESTKDTADSMKSTISSYEEFWNMTAGIYNIEKINDLIEKLK